MLDGVLGAGERPEVRHPRWALELPPLRLEPLLVLEHPLAALRQVVSLLGELLVGLPPDDRLLRRRLLGRLDLLLAVLLALPRLFLLLDAALLLLAAGPQAAALGAPGTGGPVLLLVLDPPVLEPDLDLLLREPEVRRDLDAPEPRQVHVPGELALELEELGTGEGRANAFRAVGDERAVRGTGRRRRAAAVPRR